MIECGKKLAELDFMYDLGLRRSEFKTITAKLRQQKASYDTDDEWLAAVESLTNGVRNDPLKQEIKKQAYAVSQLCPVCGEVSEPITLMRNRKAYYCKKHKAVSPAIVNE
jgi:predicted RNA-binding Zn-ribbon protein involved in translation (DUF1610 family)